LKRDLCHRPEVAEIHGISAGRSMTYSQLGRNYAAILADNSGGAFENGGGHGQGQ
jgi:hypothetical protein